MPFILAYVCNLIDTFKWQNGYKWYMPVGVRRHFYKLANAQTVDSGLLSHEVLP